MWKTCIELVMLLQFKQIFFELERVEVGLTLTEA